MYEINIFWNIFWNDVIMTGNDQKWHHVWRNDQMITSGHIFAKKHIVGVSLKDFNPNFSCIGGDLDSF